MDRPKGASSGMNGSWCCCMSPTAKMLFGEMSPQDNAENKSKEERRTAKKTALYKFRQSGMEFKNLRTQHQNANRKERDTTLKRSTKSLGWHQQSICKDMKQYHQKNTEKSCLLMPLSSHSTSGFRGSLDVSAFRFWLVDYH